MNEYAKAIVAIIGVGTMTLLALIPPETTLWIVLTVAAAMTTAAGVYLVPNEPAAAQRPTGGAGGHPYG